MTRGLNFSGVCVCDYTKTIYLKQLSPSADTSFLNLRRSYFFKDSDILYDYLLLVQKRDFNFALYCTGSKIIPLKTAGYFNSTATNPIDHCALKKQGSRGAF